MGNVKRKGRETSPALFPFDFAFPLKSVLSSEAFPPSDAGEAERPASDACLRKCIHDPKSILPLRGIL